MATHPTRTGHARRRLLFIALSCVALVTAAALLQSCVVSGERAEYGACPWDETCSDTTPNGLHFWGETLFDGKKAKLGPVLVDGTFGFAISGLEGQDFAVEVGTPGVLVASKSGDSGVNLRGVAAGVTYVRIVDPVTGELFDRLMMQVHSIKDVTLRNLTGEPEVLYAGCEQMIAVGLLADSYGSPMRAFDKSVTVTVDGKPGTPEGNVWDCFATQVPKDAKSVSITVKAGGKTFQRTMYTQTLEEGGLKTCPEPAPTD